MTVTVDLATENVRTGTGSPTTWSHGGASSGVKGVLVLFAASGAYTNAISAVSYGGVPLSQAVFTADTAGEDGYAAVWFLGASVPQGTQTVSYTTGAVTEDIHAVCVTLLAGGDTRVIDICAQSGDRANPQGIMQYDGNESMAFVVLFSGLAATTSITDGAGLTRLHDNDFGQTVSVVVRQTTAGTSDFTASFTASSDDVALAGCAISDTWISQDTWRFRADDGSESAATWLETAGVNHSFTVAASLKARIRFALSTPGAKLNVQPVLEACVPGGNNALWQVKSSVYSGDSFDCSSQDSSVAASVFKPDGTAMYVVGDSTNTIYQYTLSTAWDLTTASYANKSVAINGQDTTPAGIAFKSDGTVMYMVGSVNNAVFQYTLSTAWDVSTASYASKNFSVGSEDLSPSGVCFKSDGTAMYVAGASGDAVEQYTLSTAWDISTASYASKSLSVGGYENGLQAVVFKPDGTAAYTVGTSGPAVYQYLVNPAWDLSGASYGGELFVVSAQTIYPVAVAFDADGSLMMVLSGTLNDVFRYDLLNLWFNVTTTSSYVKATDSTNLTHAADTTQQITSGTFITPNSGVSETGTAGTDNDMDFTAGSKCEVEYAIEFVGDNLVADDEVWFRLKNADTWQSPMYAVATINKVPYSMMFLPNEYFINHMLVR